MKGILPFVGYIPEMVAHPGNPVRKKIESLTQGIRILAILRGAVPSGSF